jgi:hypothetical protein
MLVTVPSRYKRYSGMAGLGQCLADDEVTVIACPDTPLMTGPTPTLTPTSSSSDPSSIFLPDSLNPNNASVSSSSTTAQDIAALGPALAAAAKGITAASGPYQIPNTNYIYNPATGQILLNGSAVGMYNAQTGAITAVGSVNFTMLLALGAGVVLLVMLMGGRK